MGEHFGDYEIEGRIGAGGMAEVYVATRRGAEGFKKRVCLKRVLTGDERDGDLVRHFQDEARLAAHLHHPTIAAVHDLGQVDGKWFMSMELVEGIDLRTLVTALKARGERAPLEVVFQVAQDVSTALAYAHGLVIDGKPAGIVHRDVTPSNVLLSIHGEIKLADFGIAKASTRLHRTRTGVVKGKVPYMAPEQALGDALDQRTDLFALGVMLYELCAGRRPHDGATDLDTLTNAQKARREPLSKIAPDVPFELVSLIDRMLAPKPAGRPNDAQAVLDALAGMPSSSSARRTIAALVVSARDPRKQSMAPRRADGAPETRAAGVRLARNATVEALDGPTMVSAPTLEPTTLHSSETSAAPRASSTVLAQFALGFGVVFTLGALGLLAIVLVFAGDRIAEAAVGSSSPTPSAPIAVAPQVAAIAPPKPPEEAPQVRATPAPIVDAPPPSSPRRSRPRSERSDERPERSDERHVSSRPHTGHLAVLAFPFGDVDIDGDHAGRAPVDRELSEGEHTVVVTNGDRRISRTATVRRGQTTHLEIDLMGAD